MPSFGAKSLERLETCDPRLQEILVVAIEIMDFSIICGHRDKKAQNKAYETGKSKLRYPASKHNKMPSLAVDIIPYPCDWSNTANFFYLAGVIHAVAGALGYQIRWGGDWKGILNGKHNPELFNDLPHFEIVGELVQQPLTLPH